MESISVTLLLDIFGPVVGTLLVIFFLYNKWKDDANKRLDERDRFLDEKQQRIEDNLRGEINSLRDEIRFWRDKYESEFERREQLANKVADLLVERDYLEKQVKKLEAEKFK